MTWSSIGILVALTPTDVVRWGIFLAIAAIVVGFVLRRRFESRDPFRIRKQGIEIEGDFLEWGEIDYCRWRLTKGSPNADLRIGHYQKEYVVRVPRWRKERLAAKIRRGLSVKTAK